MARGRGCTASVIAHQLIKRCQKIDDYTADKYNQESDDHKRRVDDGNRLATKTFQTDFGKDENQNGEILDAN